MKVDYSACKLLIVDDIPTNVLLLKVMLEQEGFLIYTAHSGQEALVILNTNRVDLILLDVLMPDINGFELAGQLRSRPEWEDIPVIFITALNAPSDVVKGFQSGGHDFISKPFNKEELLVRIKHQLSLSEAKKIILRQKEELQKAIEGRDKLYSVIAHDLRTPMSSLKMILNALMLQQESLNIEEDYMEMLKNANEISEAIFSLLDNLLKWTKSQLGKLQPIPQNINLSDLTQGLVSVYTSVSLLKKIDISFQGPEQAEVFVDIDMIKTIIRNLLSNAVKFSHPGGHIKVELKTSEDEVRLEVCDQGCGISEANQQKLLDISTHYTTYGTANEEGAGLGLLLVHEFLKYNQGVLYFHSEEKKGSCFGFTLPLLKTKAK